MTTSSEPVRVRIVGQFWDTQIYSGELVLFGRDGTLRRLNWRKFVAELDVPPELRVVADAALIGSKEFYSDSVMQLAQDPEIQPIMLDKFRRLEEWCRDLYLDVDDHGTRSTNPFPFPHSDSEFHYGSLFVGARSGVYVSGGPELHSRNPSARKLAETPCLDVAAKHSYVAVAAGSDGLFQLQSHREEGYRLSPVASNACSVCDWSYASIVGSNHGREMFVAAFSLVREEPNNRNNKKKFRHFEGIIRSNQLFGTVNGDTEAPAIEWGAKDRLYRYRAGTFSVIENASNGKVEFRRLDNQRADDVFDDSEFVSVRVATFGSVLEFDSHLRVVLNTGKVLRFEGEPVSWRVFPWSINYLNHLHIVYDDYVEIVAFTSDYFVRAEDRRFGTNPTSSEGRHW